MSEKGKASDEFAGKTISAMGWSSGQQVLEQAVQFVITIVLARMLLPADFGLVGLVLVFTGFASLFVDIGFGAALVQRKDLRPEHLDTVFWFNLMMGAAATGTMAALAPMVARFYRDERLTPITLALSLTLVIGSLSSVHRVLLAKHLDFKRLAVIGWGTRILAGITGIGLAAAGFGYWSIVLYTLANTSFNTLNVWIGSSWRPGLRFSRAALGELFGFSANYFGFQALNYLVRNGDNLLVGRYLGASALGIYSRAYSLMLFPLRQISGIVSRVMFPALATIQDDPARVGRVYLRVCSTIALITAPLMVGLTLVAEPFVLFVFGAEWIPMIPVLRILTLVGFLQSVGTLVGNLYLSQGRSDLMLRVGGVVSVLGVLSFVVGLRWGVEGVAASYAVMSAVVFIPQQHIALRLVGLSVVDLVRAIAGSAAASAVMGGAIALISLAMGPGWSPGLELLVLVPSGVAVYLLTIHLAGLAAYRDAIGVFSARFRRPRAATVPAERRAAAPRDGVPL